VPFATPSFLLASAGGERFAIPVLFLLALLAFAFALSGVVRRGSSRLTRSTKGLRNRLKESAGYPKDTA
jgi:hypothetical protein